LAKRLENNRKILTEAETLVKHAGERLQTNFPGWQIEARATYGSPGWEILEAASEFKPGLIVVGSRGRNSFQRFLLGSVSQKVLSHAKCSVRVARGKNEVEPGLNRIAIAYDGSKGAKLAVSAVANRWWPEGSQCLLVMVTDSLAPSAIGRFISPVGDWVREEIDFEKAMMEKMAQPAIKKLTAAGLKVDLRVASGDPKQILPDVAQEWGADCIFAGANKHGAIEDLILGSVSEAVAVRAHCSVEVVRPHQI
jgi:nucleotide-binding universal stress UspA family protein